RTAVIDVRERREVQKSLAQSQRDFQALVEGIEGLVWEVDAATFRLSFLSRSAERLLGYSVQRWYEAGGWAAFSHVEDRERVLNQLAEILVDHQQRAIEYRFIANNRRIVWVRDLVNVRHSQGRLKICGVAVDITERKQAEQQLFEAREHLESIVAD